MAGSASWRGEVTFHASGAPHTCEVRRVARSWTPHCTVCLDNIRVFARQSCLVGSKAAAPPASSEQHEVRVAQLVEDALAVDFQTALHAYYIQLGGLSLPKACTLQRSRPGSPGTDTVQAPALGAQSCSQDVQAFGRCLMAATGYTKVSVCPKHPVGSLRREGCAPAASPDPVPCRADEVDADDPGSTSDSSSGSADDAVGAHVGTAALQHLVQGCLGCGARQLSMAEVVQHPWFTDPSWEPAPDAPQG